MSDTRQKPGILIVDDQVEVGLLESTLRRDEYELLTATSGEQAIKLASERQPDLIILDMTMPDTDGLELCRSLKSDAGTEDIAVVFLSAIADAETKARGLELGAVDYIQKPFEPSELRARVQAHLRLKERLDALRAQFLELQKQLEKETRGSGRGPIDGSSVDRESKTVSFKTDVGRVQGIVNQLLVGISGRISEKLRNDLALGIHEMVLNALEHGNLGITSEAKSEALESRTFQKLIEERLAEPQLADRMVRIEYNFDGQKVSYRIADEGDGFDWSRFVDRDEPEDLLASNGRGIIISRYIFDRVVYNEKGNEVFLEKRVVGGRPKRA